MRLEVQVENAAHFIEGFQKFAGTKPPIIQNPTFKIQHLSLHGPTACRSKSPYFASSSPPATATVAAPYDAEALSALFGRKNKKRTE
jgi:hypothetical protein